jgi:hypothetical protein
MFLVDASDINVDPLLYVAQIALARFLQFLGSCSGFLNCEFF